MIGLWLLLAALPLGAQFSATTTIARVEARAVDSVGNPLLGLEARHFEVRDNDTPQKIDKVAREELPLDLAIVIDVSSSMKSHVAKVAANARQALALLQPGDRILVMKFNAKNEVILPLTADLDAASAALNRLASQSFGGGTVINTPIRDAARLLRQSSSPDRRRAIVIVTDGIGLKGTRSSTTLTELWEADATLNALMVPPNRLTRSLNIYRKSTSPAAYLLDASVPDLAAKSGGDSIDTKNTADPLAEVLRRIRSRYTIYFQPDAPTAKEHKVFVSLSDTGRREYPQAKVSGRRQFKAD